MKEQESGVRVQESGLKNQKSTALSVMPKRLVNPDDVLTPAEAKRVRRGMEQIKAGRFKLWRDVKSATDRRNKRFEAIRKDVSLIGQRPPYHYFTDSPSRTASIPEGNELPPHASAFRLRQEPRVSTS